VHGRFVKREHWERYSEPTGNWCLVRAHAYGGACGGPGVLHPEKLLRMYMQNHAIYCALLAFLNTLTIEKAFPRVPLEMTAGHGGKISVPTEKFERAVYTAGETNASASDFSQLVTLFTKLQPFQVTVSV